MTARSSSYLLSLENRWCHLYLGVGRGAPRGLCLDLRRKLCPAQSSEEGVLSGWCFQHKAVALKLSDIPGAQLSSWGGVAWLQLAPGGPGSTWSLWTLGQLCAATGAHRKTESEKTKNPSPFLPLVFLLLMPHIAEANRKPASREVGDLVYIIPATYYREELRRASQRPQINTQHRSFMSG